MTPDYKTDTQSYLGLSTMLANISSREYEGWAVRQIVHVSPGDVFIVVYEQPRVTV